MPLVLVALLGCSNEEPAARQARAAQEIEARLFAPCCWTQTLDAHSSPLADELRAEIVARTGAGEPAAAIEDDLAARYGERIRAVPRDVRSGWLGVPFVIAAGLAALALGLFARRLRGGGARGAPAPGPGVVSAASAHDRERMDRLDDELLELD